MANVNFFDVHRTWEDYLGMALGFLVLFSPLLGEAAHGDAVLINTGAIGVAIMAFAALEVVDLHRWEEGLQMLLGLWLAASPFIFSYADGGTLMTLHMALGALVALLAMYELWQDWKLSEEDLAKHGH